MEYSSFANKWMINVRSSLDSAGAQDGRSSVDVDPALLPMRWTIDVNGFHFDSPGAAKFPAANQCRDLKATTAAPPKRRSSSLKPPADELCSGTRTDLCSRNANLKQASLQSLRKILWGYLCLLMPLLKREKSLRLLPSSKPAKRVSNSAGSSRRMSSSSSSSSSSGSTRSSIEWCRSNADISISDAILHCKRSNGQENH